MNFSRHKAAFLNWGAGLPNSLNKASMLAAMAWGINSLISAMRLSSTNMLCFEFFPVLSKLNTPVCKAHAAACVNATDSSGSGENLTKSKNSLWVVTKLVSYPKNSASCSLASARGTKFAGLKVQPNCRPQGIMSNCNRM